MRGRTRPIRKRRRWLIVLGSIFAAIGVIFGGLALYEAVQTTHPDVAAGSAYQMKPVTLTPVSATISWSGAVKGTIVYVVTGTVTCSSPPDVVATKTAVSGHIDVALHKGPTYALYACSSGAYESLQFKVTLSGGLTVGDIIAIVFLGLGIPLIALGFRGRLVDPYDEE